MTRTSGEGDDGSKCLCLSFQRSEGKRYPHSSDTRNSQSHTPCERPHAALAGSRETRNARQPGSRRKCSKTPPRDVQRGRGRPSGGEPSARRARPAWEDLGPHGGQRAGPRQPQVRPGRGWGAGAAAHGDTREAPGSGDCRTCRKEACGTSCGHNCGQMCEDYPVKRETKITTSALRD